MSVVILAMLLATSLLRNCIQSLAEVHHIDAFYPPRK